MKQIAVRTSFLSKGEIKSNEYTIKTIGDLGVLFGNAVKDAELCARLRRGKIAVKRDKDTLYISFLDVPNYHIIDRFYKLI